MVVVTNPVGWFTGDEVTSCFEQLNCTLRRFWPQGWPKAFVFFLVLVERSKNFLVIDMWGIAFGSAIIRECSVERYPSLRHFIT